MDTQLALITQWLTEHHQPKFRFKQMQTAWYQQPDWEHVSTLPKELRQALATEFSWLQIKSYKIATSPADGTKKAIIELNDGQKIETVCMPNAREKRTICISSQVGCAMACTFCATGTMGLKRNLTVDEIVDQVRFWQFQDLGEEPGEISNIVFMGMGEPLANYDNVKAAAKVFSEDMGIGKTRIVISTVGVPVILKKILEDITFPDVRLALSLHAGTNETRSKIVPSNKHTSVQALHDWVKQYLEVHGNRRHHLTLEYVMLLNVNDMPEEAKALGKLFSDIAHQVKLNLIPWNQIDAELKRSSEHRMRQFQSIVERYGITTTIRYSKGLDIMAACGQLVIQSSNELPLLSKS